MDTRSAAHRKMLSKRPGRPPKFATADELEAKFEEYFNRQDDAVGGRSY